jgi:hypothetical protein
MTNYLDLAARVLDGGFTYDPKTDTFPTSGFATGIWKGREVQVPLIEFTHRDLANFVDKNAKALLTPGVVFGSWLYEGAVYIDVSMVVPTFGQAVDLCRHHDQIAFYDLARRETVYMKDILQDAA